MSRVHKVFSETKVEKQAPSGSHQTLNNPLPPPLGKALAVALHLHNAADLSGFFGQ